MGIDAVFVLLVVVLILGLLAFTRVAADAILVGGLALILVMPLPVDEAAGGGWRIGAVGVEDALAGFSNAGVATIAALFAVVAGLRETGGIDLIGRRVLGRPQSLRGAIGRLVAPVAGMSAFLNNTPVVAMLIPAVADWARRRRINPSKLMIPLSYAAILGGTCSLIGTTTNLVVSGLVLSETDLDPIGMFDITWIGLPCVIAGAAYLVILAPWLLPDRGSAASALADPREYIAEMVVPEGSPLVGGSIEEAGLRHLPGAYIVELERSGTILPAVAPDIRLQAGDRLVFAGVVDSIRDLKQLRGLEPATDQIFKLDAPAHYRRLFEAVVSDSCPVAGHSIRAGRFRNRYDAVVIAVARNGERVRGKIGDIVLRPGDTLLIEATPRFGEQHRDSRDFLLVSAIEDSTPRRHRKAPLAMAILGLMVAAVTLGVLSMLQAAMLAAGLMVFTRCCTLTEVRARVDWSLLVVIAAALGIGRAMDETGAAGALAAGVMAIAAGHPLLALAAVFLVTNLLTETITNNAAAALMFPVAITTAGELGVDAMPFVMTIMMAASASFATPLGYQTNLMVYGPGGYRFGDFVKVGLPVNLLVGAITVTLAPIVFPF